MFWELLSCKESVWMFSTLIKWITPCELAWNSVSENGARNCVIFFSAITTTCAFGKMWINKDDKIMHRWPIFAFVFPVSLFLPFSRIAKNDSKLWYSPHILKMEMALASLACVFGCLVERSSRRRLNQRNIRCNFVIDSYMFFWRGALAFFKFFISTKKCLEVIFLLASAGKAS